MEHAWVEHVSDRLVRRVKLDALPRCERCGHTLTGAQRRWCSPRCANYVHRWQRALRDYWR